MATTNTQEGTWDPEYVDPETQNWEDLSPKQLQEYTEFYIRIWKERNMSDSYLWIDFIEAFSSFTADAFKSMPPSTRGLLRDFLRQRGIYIQYSTRTMAHSALYAVTQLPMQPIWPQEELSAQIQHTDGLQSRLNATWAHKHGIQPIPRAPGESILEPYTPFRAPLTSSSNVFLTPSTSHTIDPHTRRSIRWQEDEPVTSTEELPIHQRESLTPTPIRRPLVDLAGRSESPQPSHNTGYIKELGVLSKLYKEDMQYSGFGDNFQRKLGIFEDICRKAGLPDAGKPLALSFMLKDSASDFYYDSISPLQPSFPKACDMIIAYFEGPEWHQGIKNEWHTITLRSTITKNPEKSTAECLLIMLRALSTLQLGLRDNQRDVDTLRDKVIDACRGVPATASACSNPSLQFGAFINQLKASILTYEALPNVDSRHQYPAEAEPLEGMFTDRRFQRRDRWTRHRHKDPRHQSTSKARNYRCFICQKPDCHSSRHTREERDASWQKYREESSRRYGHKLEKNARQLIAEVEGSDSDDEPVISSIRQQLVDVDFEEPENDASFFTTQGPLTQAEAQDIYHSLCVNSTLHAITRSLPATNYDPGRGNYSCQHFFGILIDTGAAKHSTCGYGQFLALQSITPIKLNTQATRHGFRFGIGNITSLGATNVPLPLGNVTFYVIQADTPFLLSLADMTRLRIYLNNVSKELIRDCKPPKTWPVIEHRGHMFLDWQNSNTPSAAYPSELDTAHHLQKADAPSHIPLNDKDLRHLHRRFGHPSVRRLQDVLQRAGYDDIPPKTIQHITDLCHLCQKHGKAPGRFKFTVKDSDSIQFNHTIFVDIMYIDSTPVLHVVDDATSLQAARWLPDMSTKTVWHALRNCWIDVYIGPPDYIVTDAGKNLTSKEFQQSAHLLGTSTKAVPVEAHWSVGKVERYHAVLRRAYAVIAADAPDTDKTTALQMAIKAINDTAGPKGLVPTLLAFGAFPRINQFDMPAASIATRAHAMQRAMSEVAKLHAQRSIRDALHARNGPDVEAIHDLPIGSNRA